MVHVLRQDLDGPGLQADLLGTVLQDHTAEDLEIANGDDLPAGPLLLNDLHDVLERHGRRQHGAAVQAVVFQVEIPGRIEGEGPLGVPVVAHPGAGHERQLDLADPVVDRDGSAPRPVAENDLHLLPGAGLEHLGESGATAFWADQLDPALGKAALHFAGGHSGLCPGPPVDGDHAPRPPAIKLGGEAVHHLVGSGIVALAAVAESAGYRSEQDDELERILAQSLVEMQQTGHLGVENAVERVRILVDEQPVLDDSGTMNHRVDVPEAVSQGRAGVGHGVFLEDVDLEVDHLGSASPQVGQIATNLALGEKSAEGALEIDRRNLGFRLLQPREENLLELALGLDACGFGAFGLRRLRRASHERQRGPVPRRQIEGDLGRDAARTSGDQNNRLRSERRDGRGIRRRDAQPRPQAPAPIRRITDLDLGIGAVQLGEDCECPLFDRLREVQVESLAAHRRPFEGQRFDQARDPGLAGEDGSRRTRVDSETAAHRGCGEQAGAFSLTQPGEVGRDGLGDPEECLHLTVDSKLPGRRIELDLRRCWGFEGRQEEDSCQRTVHGPERLDELANLTTICRIDSPEAIVESRDARVPTHPDPRLAPFSEAVTQEAPEPAFVVEYQQHLRAAEGLGRRLVQWHLGGTDDEARHVLRLAGRRLGRPPVPLGSRFDVGLRSTARRLEPGGDLGRQAADLGQRPGAHQRLHPRLQALAERRGHGLLKGPEDLDPLDRIDAEIGGDVVVELQHLGRIAGPLADHRHQHRGDLLGREARRSRYRGFRRGFIRCCLGHRGQGCRDRDRPRLGAGQVEVCWQPLLQHRIRLAGNGVRCDSRAFRAALEVGLHDRLLRLEEPGHQTLVLQHDGRQIIGRDGDARGGCAHRRRHRSLHRGRLNLGISDGLWSRIRGPVRFGSQSIPGWQARGGHRFDRGGCLRLHCRSGATAIHQPGRRRQLGRVSTAGDLDNVSGVEQPARVQPIEVDIEPLRCQRTEELQEGPHP